MRGPTTPQPCLYDAVMRSYGYLRVLRNAPHPSRNKLSTVDVTHCAPRLGRTAPPHSFVVLWLPVRPGGDGGPNYSTALPH
jgi:hypothetical protein